jgi:radical SAM superfamily enzyme YgiQ (UPF0313 family)
MISDRALVPLGLLYLASYLKSQNIDVNIIDLSGKNKRYAFGKVIEEKNYERDYKIPKTDYYGVGFVSPQFIYAKQILNKIKKKYPDAKVLAGGVHATSMPKQVLEAGFDVVVRGEGELATKKIISEGIEKKIYETNYVTDINTLPRPAYELINLESYVNNIDVMGYMNSGNDVEREINIMATRGCSDKCAFCTQYKGPIRVRSADNIMKEIKYLVEKYGVNRISFCDDNFVMNKPLLKELLPKLKDYGIKWHCLGRTDQINYDLCKSLKDSGCMGIDFGIESGSQKILDVIKKRNTVKQNEKGIMEAYKAGLKVRAQLMVGLPQETEEDFKYNIGFIKNNNYYVSKWGVHIFVPFPSCEIWDKPESFGYNINKNTDFSNFQTIGKPGEWNFIPKGNQENIARWRDEMLKVIGKYNIYETKKD